MLRLSRVLLVALAVVGGASAFDVAPASAGSFSPSLSERGIELAQYRDRNGGCQPRLALRKARALRVRGAEVVRNNRRVIVVDGYRRGRPVTLRFAQERGCPLLGVR